MKNGVPLDFGDDPLDEFVGCVRRGVVKKANKHLGCFVVTEPTDVLTPEHPLAVRPSTKQSLRSSTLSLV